MISMVVDFIVAWLPIIAVVIAIKLWLDWANRLENKSRDTKLFLKSWIITGAIVFILSFGINTLKSAAGNYHGYEKGDCLENDYDEGGEYCLGWEPVYVGIDKEFENYIVDGLKIGFLVGLIGAYGIFTMKY